MDGARDRRSRRDSPGNCQDEATHGPDQASKGRRRGGSSCCAGDGRRSAVTCLEVRERLTEYALGLLTKVDASEVERHLEWCAGCRKESAELEEGAARMALALPVIDPQSS